MVKMGVYALRVLSLGEEVELYGALFKVFMGCG